MSQRSEASGRLVIEGRPYLVNLISNPTIEDVVVTEARLTAAEIENPGTVPDGHRVARDIRDYLVRLNVER